MDEPTLLLQLMLLKVCGTAHAGLYFSAVARASCMRAQCRPLWQALP